MDNKDILYALKLMRENSKERKFKQSVDFTINLKGLDFKKPDSTVNLEITLPYPVATKGVVKSVVFVKDRNFASQIKDKVSKVVMEDEIKDMKKKQIEELATYDVLFAEGPVMLTVGKFLGQTLAPKQKMPKPITTEVSQLENALAKGQTTTKLTNKKGKNIPLIHTKVGDESSKDQELADNILTIYQEVEKTLPNNKQNIKSAFVKLTMGKPVKLGEKETEAEK